MSDAPIGLIEPGDLSEIRDYTDLMLASGHEWVSFPVTHGSLTAKSLSYFENKAKATNNCWDGLRKEAYVVAMPIRLFQEAIQSIIDRLGENMAEGRLALNVPKSETLDFSDSPKGKNLKDLFLQLKKHELVDEDTKFELYSPIEKGLNSFELKVSPKTSRKDAIEFVSHFDRMPDGTYDFTYFEGVLRKAIKMTSENSKELENVMEEVDWERLRKDPSLAAFLTHPSMQQLKKGLKDLEVSSPDGRRMADNLRFRYGRGTVLEKGIEDLEKMKQSNEASFRFSGEYFDMTAREAYFFLSLFGVREILLTDGPAYFEFLTSKNRVMNSENLEFLQENLKFLGFGEKLQLNKQLEEAIAKQPKDFQLKTTAKFDPASSLEAVLHFRRSDNDDRYFFNKYDAHLKNQDDPSNDRSQTFYITKGKGITLKEAWNLLSGRSVFKNLTNKDGVDYDAWVKLNFNEKDKHNNYLVSRYTEAYGFNVDRQLGKLPIKEASPEHARHAETLRSLKKGNMVEVETPEGEKRFISANPPAGKIEMFDAEKKQIHFHRQEISELSNGLHPSKSKDNKNDNGQEGESNEKSKRNTQKKTSGSDDLEEVEQTRKRKVRR